MPEAIDLFDLRARVLAGEDVSDEELREGIAILRQNRAAAKPQQRKAKGSAPGQSLADLFDLTPDDND